MHRLLKLKFVSLMILAFFNSNAQSDSTIYSGNDQPYTNIMDSLLAPLDKGRIPYGILYDRVFPFANLADSSTSDTITTKCWVQAYSEMQRADYSYVHYDSVLEYSDIKNYCYSENRAARGAAIYCLIIKDC